MNTLLNCSNFFDLLTLLNTPNDLLSESPKWEACAGKFERFVHQQIRVHHSNQNSLIEQYEDIYPSCCV